MYWLNVFLFCFLTLLGVFVAMFLCLLLFRAFIYLGERITEAIYERRDK